MNFDRIAPFYGPMERLLAGGCMQRARTWAMDGGHLPGRGLMVGEGPGRFLETFRRRFPAAEITVVDGSAVMLELARRRSENPGKVTFIHSRLEDWETDGRFDLIVTNFLLDCLPQSEMEDAVKKLGRWASPHAEWWIAEFNVPVRGVARWRSRVIVRVLYLFFGKVAGVAAREIHLPDEALGEAGFARVARATWSWGLLKSERWRRDGALEPLPAHGS